MKKTIFTVEDQRSATGKRLIEHLEKRIDSLRKQNDGDLDEIKTATQRGRIREARRLLAAITNESLPLAPDDD